MIATSEITETRKTEEAKCPVAPQAAHILVIINASSGLGHTAQWAEELADKFRIRGVMAEVALAASGAEILALAQSAIDSEDKPMAIVAGGGDGTINAVASIVAGTSVALGVLPLGTLNHFARDLGVPSGLNAAIDNIVHGQQTAVDVGEVNGRVFINNSSLGIYPDIVRDREKQQRRLGRGKWWAFVRATFSALHHYSLLHVRMRLDAENDGAILDRRTPFVFIGNNEYLMEGFSIGQRNGLADGKLSIYVAQRTGRLGLFRLALRALLGHLHQAKDFHALSTTELTVATRRRRLRVATDGEVTIMETPLHYRIKPNALRVIIPRKPEAAAQVKTPPDAN